VRLYTLSPIKLLENNSSPIQLNPFPIISITQKRELELGNNEKKLASIYANSELDDKFIKLD
jgi:hypothetical protein